MKISVDFFFFLPLRARRGADSCLASSCRGGRAASTALLPSLRVLLLLGGAAAAAAADDDDARGASPPGLRSFVPVPPARECLAAKSGGEKRLSPLSRCDVPRCRVRARLAGNSQLALPRAVRRACSRARSLTPRSPLAPRRLRC